MMLVVWMYGCVVCFVFFFFFKQKTAYEIGTGDWSSDVCSSDLLPQRELGKKKRGAAATRNGQYKKRGRCRNEKCAE